MTLDDALKIVRAPAGYQVSKRGTKLAGVGPTCVVRFADGEVCRMT